MPAPSASAEPFPKRRAWCDPAVAEAYETRRFGRPLGRRKHRHDAALVVRLLREVGARRVLDLPCGTGRLLPELAAAGLEPTGADLSLPMLRAEGRAAGGRVLLAAGEALPFAAGAFDAVVSLRFLFHVPDPGARVGLLREMGRVARAAVLGQVAWGPSWRELGRRLVGSGRARILHDRELLGAELAAAGLALRRVVPVSRLFSDKVLFLAEPRR